jgi:dihydroflavonol-4-reductase
MEYYREHGVPVTVVLPGTAVGAGDVGLSITRLVYLTYSGKLKFTLPGMTSFVSAPDVAEGIWLSYLRGEPGQAYLITGGREDNLSYGQFMKRVTEVARSRYHRRVSDRFIELPAALCRPLAGLLRHLPLGGLSEALVLSGTAVHRFSNAKAESHLGYRPKIPLPEAIASCLEFYLHQTSRDLR